MTIEISRKQFLRGRFRADDAVKEADAAAPEDAVGVAINSRCLSVSGTMCRLCEDECDQQAISFQLMTGGRAVPMVDESLCNGCMDCKAVCPAGAVQPVLQTGMANKETVS